MSWKFTHLIFIINENKRKGVEDAHFSGSQEFHALGYLEAIADQVLQSEGMLVEIIQI